MSKNEIYSEDVKYLAALPLPWEKLSGGSLMVTGATGMLGSLLIDAVMYKNIHEGLDCHVIAIGRDSDKAFDRFSDYSEDEDFEFFEHDINKPLTDILADDYPLYILHLASATHPLAYSSDPIGTITANIFGTYNLLDNATDELHYGKVRFLLASSNEIYGENRGDKEFFDEDYCGYINCNTLRAGYPESKRCSEALCQAFIKQKGADAVIARLTRSFGPGLLSDDTKAMTQFLKKGRSGENIILKSKGDQHFSYTYSADAVSGLLTVLLLGETGKAYNIADTPGDITLRELAEYIAQECGTKVVYDLPDTAEAAGYSTATKARLDGSEIKKLGWSMKYDIRAGVKRTLEGA